MNFLVIVKRYCFSSKDEGLRLYLKKGNRTVKCSDALNTWPAEIILSLLERACF